MLSSDHMQDIRQAVQMACYPGTYTWLCSVQDSLFLAHNPVCQVVCPVPYPAPQ